MVIHVYPETPCVSSGEQRDFLASLWRRQQSKSRGKGAETHPLVVETLMVPPDDLLTKSTYGVSTYI